LEAIAYGDDPSITPAARTAALGELARLPPDEAERREALDADQVEDERRGLARACEAGLVIMRGPEAVEPPVEVVEPRETL
jgi:hypothetical protein